MDLSTRLRVLVQSPSPLLGGGAVARLAGLTPRPLPPPPPPTAAASRLAVLAAGGRVPALWELPTASAAAPAAGPPRERRPWTAPAPAPRLAAHRRADAFKPAPRGGGAPPRRGPSDPPPVASSPRRPAPTPSSATRPPLPPPWSDEPSVGTFSAVTSPSMLSPDGRPSPPVPAAATAAAPSPWSPPRSPPGGRDRWAWPPAAVAVPAPPATARRARPAPPVPPVPPPSPVALPAPAPPGAAAPGGGAAPTDGRDGGAEGGSPPRPTRRRASRPPTAFKCTHPGCNVVSRFRSYARTHARLHSSELPFVCPVDGCGRRFKWASSLGYHKRRHAALEKQAQELRAFCDNF